MATPHDSRSRSGGGAGGGGEEPPLETTATLIQFARRGDRAARNRLLRRYHPVLTRWAHGRLPSYARDLSETGDLVQQTLIKALRAIDSFEHRHEGAFLAWLRAIFINEVRDEIRSAGRRPWKVELGDDLVAHGASPLADLLTAETFSSYERALATFPDTTREAIILRIEFGFSYPEIAAAIGSSENAVRMRVTRAVARLATIMGSRDRGRDAGGVPVDRVDPAETTAEDRNYNAADEADR